LKLIYYFKYTFKDSVLISTEILSAHGYVFIYPLYEDTKSVLLAPVTPLKSSIIKLLDKSANYKTELFILFELLLVFLIFFIFFVLFPDNSTNTVMSIFSTHNIIKLRKTQSIHSWKTIQFTLNNLVFTTDLFKTKFNVFWNKVKDEFTDNNHMFILFKVKYKGSDYATIGNLQRLTQNDREWYINWIINNMILKSEYYNETPVESFVFSFGFKDEKISEKEIIKTNLNFQKYKNNKLVISYNPLEFGILISKTKFDNYIQFILQNNDNILVRINQFDKYNEVSLISGGNTILNFKDEFIMENKFVRILDNKKFYFENNSEILFLKDMKTKFISKLSATKNLKNKFITLDIETFVKEKTLIPYLIKFYDGINCYSYWLGNYSDVEAMILDCFKDLLIRKYNSSNVYIHNLAKFDIIFLLKYLVKLGSVHPIIHNGRIICINLNYGKDNEYQINFKDSYLILLSSLRSLCKSFNVKNGKTIFPHLFVN
jgi:hypothetical protein